MKGIRKFCAKFFSSIKYEVFLGIALINLVVLLLFLRRPVTVRIGFYFGSDGIRQNIERPGGPAD